MNEMMNCIFGNLRKNQQATRRLNKMVASLSRKYRCLNRTTILLLVVDICLLSSQLCTDAKYKIKQKEIEELKKQVEELRMAGAGEGDGEENG